MKWFNTSHTLFNKKDRRTMFAGIVYSPIFSCAYSHVEEVPIITENITNNSFFVKFLRYLI